MIIKAEPQPMAPVAPFLLGNSGLLRRFLSSSSLDYGTDDEVKEAVYLAYHGAYPAYPDHVFHGLWSTFVSQYQQRPGHWLVPSLKALADEFLCFQHGRLHVMLCAFDEWQHVVSRVDCMPARVGAFVWGIGNCGGTRLSPPERKADLRLNSEFLARPWDPAVEDYIAREGLHETHVHLNGSTQVALCWQYALQNPQSELQSFGKIFRSRDAAGARVRELCRTIDVDLTPASLISALKDARDIRAWLIKWVHSPNSEVPKDLKALRSAAPDISSELKKRFSSAEVAARAAEWDWIFAVLSLLYANPNRAVEKMLHLYFLIFNQFRQLLVQRVDMVGFDQFQKYTYTELREGSEKEYCDRFQQMHGHLRDSRQFWVEGRLAPKATLEKNHDLLLRVLGGYSDYLVKLGMRDHLDARSSRTLSGILASLENLGELGSKPRYVKLALVIHFIKSDRKKTDSYIHSSLRNSLSLQVDALAATLNRWPNLRRWVRGVDAAANELHAPPDVFAPVFRFCSRIGITHRTYHVGEDFLHLVGGIRSIVDALEFLELRNGDRLGHCTAIGIDPSLWLKRMPAKVVVKSGDWMLDVLRAWQLSRDNPSLSTTSAKLERVLERTASEIFGVFCSASDVERVMAMRGLMPKYVFEALDSGDDWTWRTTSLNDAWREEAKLVAEVTTNRHHLRMLAAWWKDSAVISRAAREIKVATDFIDVNGLLSLQQAVLAEIRDRHVIIETLPTSNVRIAPYISFSEHHSLRWMKAPGFAVDGDPDIMISFGSDDPGIFSNDLSTDFYQLYAVMRNRGLSDVDAISLLAKPNERGRQYKFHASDNFSR